MAGARKLLYPFSLLYGGVMLLRNKMYDSGIFASQKFEVPVIAVGNLSVGGTGKSPMVEYLIGLLKEDLRVASLSRGYKRSSSGFHLLSGDENAAAVGDEPLQFKNKFLDVAVAVDESRRHGIEELLKQPSSPEVILLDDAFQHRKVRAGLYILLTPYNNLYTGDLVLPAGNLREPKEGAARAGIVVVTKCPPQLSIEEQEEIAEKLQLQPGQALFFSSISYAKEVFSRNSDISLKQLKKKHFKLITGIANPAPLVAFLKEQSLNFDHKAFPDHHNFSDSEIAELKKTRLLVTTEKDYMRLKDEMKEEQLFYLPIKTEFLRDEEGFKSLIKAYLQKS